MWASACSRRRRVVRLPRRTEQQEQAPLLQPAARVASPAPASRHGQRRRRRHPTAHNNTWQSQLLRAPHCGCSCFLATQPGTSCVIYQSARTRLFVVLALVLAAAPVEFAVGGGFVVRIRFVGCWTGVVAVSECVWPPPRWSVAVSCRVVPNYQESASVVEVHLA